MAGMFVNLRKKSGLVTVCYINDLKWLLQTNCIDGKMYVRFYGFNSISARCTTPK